MDHYPNYGSQQDPPSGYNYPQYNDAYSQSGYSATANTSEYYYGSGSAPTAGSNSSNSGANPQPTTPSTSSQGYAPHPRSDGYEGGTYSSSYNYGNYPAPAASGSYQTGPGSSSTGGGGSINSTAPYNTSGSGYSGGTNKTSYPDRGSDYGDGPSYGGNKNPYGENFSNSYKSRDNSRDGYGPPSKEGNTFDSYGSRSEDNFTDESLVQTSADTVYVSNLSKDVTEEKLIDHFGSLGMLKIDKRTQKPKIWIYYDKVSGVPKGDATVTYEDADSTAAAIKYFDNQPFLGQIIKVEMSVRKVPSTGFRGRGRVGRGRTGFTRGGAGRGGPPPRDGDWTCESCHANNFARRMECYKCHSPRSDAPGDDTGYNSSRYSGSVRGGYRVRRGGGPVAYGSRYNDDDRGYGSNGYRNNDSSSSGHYDQGYGKPSKQDDRQDRRDRYRPY
ncbi:11755_t:CDS:2 [Diversispora eburnea]|uniref:11755_t:CDS:1 n=1 Tax=Diversispora eburnea TaxID=1213867 RepID=A0A9N9AVU7_9GLOM|nr:11755_t:CDS:2 [Diversispora eburnea]